jgi:hypothetical protein
LRDDARTPITAQTSEQNFEVKYLLEREGVKGQKDFPSEIGWNTFDNEMECEELGWIEV